MDLSGRNLNEEIADKERLIYLIEQAAKNTSTVAPNHIYGLGGAGTRMVLESLRQDWFLVNVLVNRRDTLHVHLIDTATGEEANVEQEVNTLKNRIENIRGTCRKETNGVDLCSIEISRYNINETVSINHWDDLIGSDFVEEILSSNLIDVDSWWLNRSHLQSERDSSSLFSVKNGVIKRRALSKALHYKCQLMDPDYGDEFETNYNEDRVAICCSLGGGTGSGLAIEVASEMYQANPAAEINLFTTLPSREERSQSLQNAYAALGELEYLSLDEELNNPFNQTFLFSLEPASHTTGGTDSDDMLEFDATMPYVLSAVYEDNNQPDFAMGNATSYAPFTAVVPQILRYKRDAIKDAERRTTELFKTKQQALNTEFIILNNVEEYLNENHPELATVEIEVEDLQPVVRQYLRDRIITVANLLTFEVLEYKDMNVDDNNDILERIYGDTHDVERDDIEAVVASRSVDEIIQGLKPVYRGQNRDGDEQIDQYHELDDEFVEDLIYHELQRIARLRDVCKQIYAVHESVDTDLYRRTLNQIAIPSIEGKSRIEDLINDVDEIEKDVKRHKNEIGNIEQELQRERNSSSSQIESKLTEYAQDVDGLIAEYRQLNNWDLRDQQNKVKRQLREFVSKLADPNADNLEQTLNDIVSEAKSIDTQKSEELTTLATEWMKRIVDEVEAVPQARIEWKDLEAQINDDGWRSKIFDDGPVDTTTYQENSAGLGTVIDVPPGSTERSIELNDFDAQTKVKYEAGAGDDLFDWIENRKEEIDQELQLRFEGLYSSISEGGGTPDVEVSSLVSVAHSDGITADTEEKLKEALREGSGSRVPELEENQQNLQAKVDRMEERKEERESLLDLYYDNESSVGKLQEQLSEFRDQIREYNIVEGDNGGISASRDGGTYINEVGVDDEKVVSAAISVPSMVELIAKNRTNSSTAVEDELLRELNNIVAKNMTHSKYSGVNSRKLNREGKGSYDQVAAYTAFIGEVFNDRQVFTIPDSELESFQQKVTGNYIPSNAQTNVDRWSSPASHPWEAAVITFYQGMTMLDNIRPAMKYYRGSYMEDADPRGRLVRHSLGLDNGYYTWREQIFPPENDLRPFLGDDSEIRQRLKEAHQIVRYDVEKETAQPNAEGNDVDR
ncbi:hypothetical protein EKH57_00535 (plasmid) [Halorubrum sp. BOL3-1]|uniref:tubulin-like doman-containing protein n=1 Tax=Halorubrum sp. BOL3-1 TaxID=2497325 RepID=UPI001004F4DB|nr:tubulin-like doman-containing protein [Halorubrum sp. BOL3-1]QAU11394.1 hypothetical protein EKH57_00535 [Halorubrum sp. BOL3-1]